MCDETVLKAMSKALGWIRKTAARSMRSDKTKKQNAAKPGMPPKFRASDENVSLRNIQYHYEPSEKTGIVGPIKLNQMQQGNNGVMQRGVVPALHEFGGEVSLIEQLRWVKAFGEMGRDSRGKFTTRKEIKIQKWIPVYNRKKIPKYVSTRIRKAVYPKRPFMAKALDKAIQKKIIPQAFAGKIGTV
jgi:hypothetical protein